MINIGTGRVASGSLSKGLLRGTHFLCQLCLVVSSYQAHLIKGVEEAGDTSTDLYHVEPTTPGESVFPISTLLTIFSDKYMVIRP